MKKWIRKNSDIIISALAILLMLLLLFNYACPRRDSKVIIQNKRKLEKQARDAEDDIARHRPRQERRLDDLKKGRRELNEIRKDGKRGKDKILDGIEEEVLDKTQKTLRDILHRKD